MYGEIAGILTIMSFALTFVLARRIENDFTPIFQNAIKSMIGFFTFFVITLILGALFNLVELPINVIIMLILSISFTVILGDTALLHIFPKVKGSELDKQQKKALFESIKTVVNERIKLGGKCQFIDFYGKKGQYIPAMGPNMKDKKCLDCSSGIEKLSVGGGQVYYCPHCQEG